MIQKVILALILAVDLNSVSANVAGSTQIDYYDVLKQHLFSQNKIDPKIKPVEKNSHTVTVNTTITVMHVYKLDEETGTLAVSGWIAARNLVMTKGLLPLTAALQVSQILIPMVHDVMIKYVNLQSVFYLYWIDPQLKWNPEDYDNLQYFEVPETYVWKPDLVTLNSAEDSIANFQPTVVFIYHDGKVRWNPHFVSLTSCPIDHKYFPFDEHICTIEIGSWSYSSYSLMLQNPFGEKEDDTAEQFRTESPLWKIEEILITNHNVTILHFESPYPFIRYTMRLTRKSPLYKFIIVLPTVMSIVLTLAVFWLPQSTGQRITLGGITVFIQLLMLISLGFSIPQGGQNVPHIVLLCGNSLVMTCLSMVISILVIRLSRGHCYKPLPSQIKDVLNGPFGLFLCIGQSAHQNDISILNEENPESEVAEGMHEKSETGLNSKTSTFGDWLLLATAIDHSCFLGYVIIFVFIIIGAFI